MTTYKTHKEFVIHQINKNNDFAVEYSWQLKKQLKKAEALIKEISDEPDTCSVAQSYIDQCGAYINSKDK